MCGIFGVISTKINTEKLNRVSNVIKHRGPDDAGFLLFNNDTQQEFKALDSIPELNLPILSNSIDDKFNSAFLHRRLSIVDLTLSGHQPMPYNRQNTWITFNGEIYNYIEIKKELESEGYTFYTKSDTEVILAAYQKWSFDCVKKFNGMWAFAIWDKTKDLIFISRDRFGIKPLYFYKNKEFLFCSEIKGIKAYLDSKLTINREQLIYFATNGQTKNGDEETIFNEINQLKPGHNLIYQQGKFSVTKYWELNISKNNNSFEENKDVFLDLFTQSINYRMRSDVEIGSCLSGGLDSSSIVSLTSYFFKKNIHTFSAVWPNEKCDESKFIDSVIKKYNCVDHRFTPKYQDHFLEIFDKLIWHQEIPLPGSSLLAQWFVMNEAKEKGIKVLLDGQGADEVLAGYPRHVIPYINELLYTFKFKEIINNYSNLKKNNFSIKNLLSIQKNKITPKIKSHFTLTKDVQISNKKEKNNYSFNSLSEYLKYEIETYCLPSLLHFEDRNSMAHSIETRIPFLDYKLVDFCFSIPSEQKIKGTLTKVILREAMKKYLPVEIYNRRDKIGFETPIEKNMLTIEGNVYEKMLDQIHHSKILELNIFNKKTFKDEIIGNEYKLYSLARFIDQWTN
jgi:asparagine synthase (glutamine-hydrolysing)